MIAIKDEAKKVLIAALDQLADTLERNANGDLLYLTNAGLPLRQPNRRRMPVALAAPEGLRLRAGKNSGEALVEFGAVLGARLYAVEWSAGDDTAWHNGNYASARRVVIQVPPRQDIRVRVCALGNGNRHSAWSAPVAAFVP